MQKVLLVTWNLLNVLKRPYCELFVVAEMTVVSACAKELRTGG